MASLNTKPGFPNTSRGSIAVMHFSHANPASDAKKGSKCQNVLANIRHPTTLLDQNSAILLLLDALDFESTTISSGTSRHFHLTLSSCIQVQLQELSLLVVEFPIAMFGISDTLRYLLTPGKQNLLLLLLVSHKTNT